jgi:hypothetical protein
VRFTVAVDVHFPFLLPQFRYLDEGGAHIDWRVTNAKGVVVHDFGVHDGRKLWNHHYIGRSLEALAWKGVRQVVDDTGGGNARSMRSMLGTVIGMNIRDAEDETQLGAIRDAVAWMQGREFMLRVLLGVGPPSAAARALAIAQASADWWPELL